MEGTSHSKTHTLFIISLIVKGVFGLLETFGSFLFFATGTVTSILIFLTAEELGEDPNDFLANEVAHFLPFLSTHSQLFIAWYLLIHGAVKLVLVGALFGRKLWAYPVSIVTLFLFLAYQLYQLHHGFSFFIATLSFFDVLVMYLVWKEYTFLRKHINM